MPGGYNQVAIPVFSNRTHEAGVEVYFTNALLQQFQRSRIAQLSSKDQAQLIVEGVVTKVTYHSSSPERTSGISLSRNYRITVSAEILLRRNSDRKVIWSSSFQNEGTYAAPQVTFPSLNSVDPIYNHSARYENIAKLASEMMEEAHDRMTEMF